MRVSPFTVAEESLGASSAMRGLGGMERTAAPKGPNMFDGGPASKVQVNTQPFNNNRSDAAKHSAEHHCCYPSGCF